VLAGALALGLLAVASPAQAQMGSIKGKVVDEAGQPVPDADLVFDFIGDVNRQFKGKTDKRGEYIRAGLQVVGGKWRVTATKEGLSGRSLDLDVPIGSAMPVPDIVLKAGKPAGGTTASISKEEADKRNKRNAELEKSFNEAKAASDAGNYDEAIAKLQAVAGQVDKCAPCYVYIGDAYLKKKDLDNAEKSFLKAIELDEKNVDSYNALATLYNEQKKFEEAAKMGQKAAELATAGGGTADPIAVFNQGIIFWNQSKIPEAKAQFAKAVELNPKLADAQYWLGMAFVNQGDLPGAKKPFEEYLKLAPTGQYADTAKALLASIK
jgi:tetratricopeptide (TPR) repeat protein